MNGRRGTSGQGSPQAADRRRWRAPALAAAAIALGTVAGQQVLHRNLAESAEPGPLLHWLRDSALMLPIALVAVAVALLPEVSRRMRRHLAPVAARTGWCLVVALVVGASTIPGGRVHDQLFVAPQPAQEHAHMAMGAAEHLLRDAAAATLISLGVALLVTLVWDPWTGRDGAELQLPGPASLRHAAARATAVLVAGGLAMATATAPAPAAPVDTAAPAAVGPTCSATVTADVVALDQAFDYNRLGATNPAGMIFALRHDVVVESGPDAGTPLPAMGAASLAGNVTLRPDKRPRPLTLRVAVGECLEIRFQNLLGAQRADDNQPAERRVGVHVKGMAVVNGISDDGTYVGRNGSSLVAPGESMTYTLYAEHENGFVLDNGAALAAGEGAGGTTAYGLFGAVNVEPAGTRAYRSQVTRTEMDLAASAWTADGSAASEGDAPQYEADGRPRVRLTADGQPILNYEARYPTDPNAVGYDAARAGLPILRVTDGGRLVHADLNAIIAGTNPDWTIPGSAYPQAYWDNQVVNEDQRLGEQPFREFTVIFHDEIFARQAFPAMFDDPATFQHTLHGVRDGFGINYGVAGAGAEVIANRLGVGPMADCVECKYEEFFLTSWAVGDPAMVVDTPANRVLAARENGDPGDDALVATYAKYPDDPSNVHHSYLNDRVKYRNLHAGPKEHHIFHLHAHQWQQTPNEPKSSYLDSQLVGPGSGFTYDIAYGGSGNRNKTVGDSIFHCHFYPHFAQGMWELWRVHDTFERGTVMDGLKPAAGSRALPDGEIVAGTPIPALVPLPSLPMAPTPLATTSVVASTLPGASQASAQVDLNGDGTADAVQDWLEGVDNAVPTNPGYPFFIAAAAGHRPPTPPLDLKDDGGLARHVITGGEATSFVTPRDMNKILDTAQISYPAEGGTPAEKAAMDFHAQPWHATYDSSGAAVAETATRETPDVHRVIKGFETNGLPPVAGAPFADPCRSDGTSGDGAIVSRGLSGSDPKSFKAAVIQLDATFNKVGWHFPQQRIEALWDDVGDTLTGARAPEPLVMRMNAGTCAELQHANLVPSVYELDDYQVRTPTDVIGQHIHLVKFDVTSADGSGNGFNYEDGTLSPQEVEERIHAVRAGTLAGGQPALGVPAGACSNGGDDARQGAGEDPGTPECPLAVQHPYFKDVPGVGDLAWGARTTVQRWFADPILIDSWDKGHGSVFTHDHFGPSTHQQTGLYATVLIEPEGSTWRDPETGTALGDRGDGGPTSWRADILVPGANGTPDQSHREFYLEFGDFEHAYLKGGGTLGEACNDPNPDGSCTKPGARMIPSYADPANVVNPSYRVAANSTPELFKIPADCPNGTPRPCPEAISADDIGTMLVNYRNEPIAHRIFDPATGKQATGAAGDLAFAFQSRTDRRIPELNTQPSTYGTRRGVAPGDPFTPLLRAYAGDLVRLRMQVGATEEQHNITVHGMKWRDEPLHTSSGWRNGKASGISEYFIVQSPLMPDAERGNPAQVDHLWATGAAVEDLWNGSWGILRSYQKAQADLQKLPNNQIPTKGWTISNIGQFNTGVGKGTCLASAPVRQYNVSAVRAAEILGPTGLVYNARGATLRNPDGTTQASGQLIDPTALMYVLDGDLVINKTSGRPTGLKPGVPVEPLVLRANAGDCVKVQLTNRLPAVLPDLPGYSALPPILAKRTDADGSQVTFNSNDVATSSTVGLHAQLLHYSARSANGVDVGGESGQGILPGQKKTLVWYAGEVTARVSGASSIEMLARPVEYGAVGLHSADMIEGSSKGLVGALVVEPPGATWTTDSGSRAAATVSFGGGSFRELVTVLQDDVNLRYSGACPGVPSDMKCAVPAVASEGKGVPEDSEDSGQKAINYRTDPVWYRLGISPDTPFEAGTLRDNTNVHKALSNSIVGGAEPSVPILSAKAGSQVRLRVVQPGGHARGHVMSLNGHAWQRQPAVKGTSPTSDDSDRLTWTFPADPFASSTGFLPRSLWSGSQEGVGPALHHDFLIPSAGGPAGRAGDYLFRDSASFGGYQGMWALMRVTP